MIPLPLSEIADVVDGTTIGDLRTVVDRVSTDSRLPMEGATLFVAIGGERTDGHRYVGDAVLGGARGVLVGRHPCGATAPTIVVDDTLRALRALAGHVRERVDPIAVAVTGSVGKTTVKDLVAAGLAVRHEVCASRASFNNEIGVPLTLLDLDASTGALVAEIGARRSGDIAPLAALVAPDVSIVTAVAGVHLETFGDLRAVAREKAELVAALGGSGLAVLNADFPLVDEMASRAPRALRVSSDRRDVDVSADEIRLDEHGRAHARVRTPWGRTELAMSVPGRHQAVNGMLALAAACALGVELDDAATAISRAQVSPWRGQVLRIGELTVVDDAYNANPVSMRAALDTLASVAGERPTIAVLGEMAELGEGSDREHRALGELCAGLGVDQLLVVGEAANGIAEGARSAGATAVITVADPRSAVSWIRGNAPDDAVVLVKASRVGGLEEVVRLLAVGVPAPAQAPEVDAR